MSEKALFVAKKTIFTKNFFWLVIGAIVGVILLIFGFVSLGTEFGKMGGSLTVIIGGGIIFLVTGCGAIIEGIAMKNATIKFYKNKYRIQSGLIHRRDSEILLIKILSVSVYQGLCGHLFDFGDVVINVVGRKNISLFDVKNPYGLKRYIQSILDQTDLNTIKQVIHEV
ncbi:MAG: PH domain-containing protein [Anaeroplasmataceae bacterium]|nr:PH domain-containing protein [Anaeroplasmataceae bacterium]